MPITVALGRGEKGIKEAWSVRTVSEADRGESGVIERAAEAAEEARIVARSGMSEVKGVRERREARGGKLLSGWEAELSTTTTVLRVGISGASMRPDFRSGTMVCSSGRLLRPRHGL